MRRANEKGHVERLPGFARRKFLVPVPQVDSLATLNRQLLEGCQRDLEERTPVALFPLDGRPHLAHVRVEVTPVSAYQALLDEVTP